MMKEEGFRIMKKILFGVYFILASMLVLLNGFGVLGDLNSLKIIALIFIIPVFISVIMNIGFSRITFSLALIVILFKTELGMGDISGWSFLAAAILLSIGLHILFPKRKREIIKKSLKREPDADNILITSKFNGVIKYIDSDNFTSGVVNS